MDSICNLRDRLSGNWRVRMRLERCGGLGNQYTEWKRLVLRMQVKCHGYRNSEVLLLRAV